MPSLFHEPWWLDAVAPGRWREVQVEENGRPVARLPFVERRRYGVRLLLGAPLSPRLGPLTETGTTRYETRLRRHDHLVDELLDQLPPADLFRQTLHPATLSWLPFHRHGFQVEPLLSYVLDPLDDLDAVWRGMSGQTRRVIKKAGASLEVVEDTGAHQLRRMVQATFGRQGLGVPYDPSVLDRLVQACLARRRGTVLSAHDGDGRLHASLFCAWDDERAWYLGGGSDPALRSSGAGSLLLWELINTSAKHVGRFDFEGSMLPSVERYFRNFGARQETYFRVTRTSGRFRAGWAAWQALERLRARPTTADAQEASSRSTTA